jgi:hypothetical protein
VRSSRVLYPALVLSSVLLSSPRAGADENAATSSDVDRLRDEMSRLHGSVREMSTDLRRELGHLRERMALTIATTFLSSPPPSSDVVGVARTVVFSPRIEADASRHRDVLNLRVRRVEATGLQIVGRDLEVSTGQNIVALPVDQNGSLYVVDWWTSEGYTYAVVLRDGATEQPVASVQVRPQQNRGRFLYVAYRVD